MIGTGINFISLFDVPMKTIFKLPKLNNNSSFPSFKLFAQVALQIIQNKPLNEIGELVEDIPSQNSSLIDIQKSGINGTVMHVDDYGNLITNVTKEMFDKVCESRNFTILFGRDSLNEITENYYDVNPGESVCLFNNNNFLEIAVSFGDASRLLGIDRESNIKIDFK